MTKRTFPSEKYFRSTGFNEDVVGNLRMSLIAIAKTEEVVEAVQTTFGIKYVIDGSVTSPVGVTVRIRTVWVVEEGIENPRFVTAYPRE